MNNLIRSSLSIFSQTFKQPTTISQQVRNKWTDYRMKKDARRRKTVEDYGAVKMRLNIIRKNRVIPMELQMAAREDATNHPRDSHPCRTQPRCVITSRPRGVVLRWRLSRIMFRHLADYNKLSGVQRAMW